MLSYDLRNPLAPIRNSIHVLHHADPTSPEATRARAVIARQSEHLTRIVAHHAQVMGNLLANANKFSRRGDEIAVSLREVDATAEILVRDTGAGIDPDLLPNLFSAFVQGKRTLARSEGGLGLGLALVKALVELHGGSVRAHSEGKDQGAEFVVTLPLSEQRTG